MGLIGPDPIYMNVNRNKQVLGSFQSFPAMIMKTLASSFIFPCPIAVAATLKTWLSLLGDSRYSHGSQNTQAIASE